MEVDVWVWPQLMLAQGAEVTFNHWVTLADGTSAIDPDHWYWMSAVPDYDPKQHPDGPALATGIQIVEQYATGPMSTPPGLITPCGWRRGIPRLVSTRA